jgi:hypothetical protein
MCYGRVIYPCVWQFSGQFTRLLSRIALVLSALMPALSLGGEAPLPPLQVNARAVPDKAKLGEPFAIEVAITHTKDQRYDLRPPTDDGTFDIGDLQRSRTDGKDSATTTFRLNVSGFELGQKKTPSLTFDVSTPQASGTFSTPGVDVEVVGTLPPDAEKTGAGLLDVRPPIDVAVRTWRVLYALGAVAALALLAWALRRYLKRARPISEAPAKPLEPLEIRTRAALDKLRAEDLPQKGRVREFYFRLSEIVRSYLGERYGFDALESTTPELLASLRRLHTPGLQMDALQGFANESDFVRYAKATVTPDTCKGALELAYSIVQTTTPTHATQLRVS